MLPEGEEMPRWKRNAGSTPPRLGEEVEDPGKSPSPPLPKIFPFLFAETGGLVGTALAVSFQRSFLWDGTDGKVSQLP